MKGKSKTKHKEKSRLSERKKKILGTFMVLAFIAFISITATKYVIALEISLSTIAIISLSASLVILVLMELRHRKPGVSKRPARKSNKRKR